jgi:hypothetical protein
MKRIIKKHPNTPLVETWPILLVTSIEELGNWWGSSSHARCTKAHLITDFQGKATLNRDPKGPIFLFDQIVLAIIKLWYS